MNENNLKQCLDAIKPSPRQQEHILTSMLEQIDNPPSSKYMQTTKNQFNIKSWKSLGIACSVLVAISLILFSNVAPTTQSRFPVSTPSLTAEAGMRKFMNYNGYRYIFLDDVAEMSIAPASLLKSLGTLDIALDTNGKVNPTTPFSSTFAIGGTIWQLREYNPNYRVVVALNDQYYLCEKVGRSDDGFFDLSQFFEDANLYNRITNIDITSRTENTSISTLNAQDSSSLLKLIAESDFLLPSTIDYELLFSEASRLEALTLTLHFNDATQMMFFLTPSQNIISIGDSYYLISHQASGMLKQFISP